MKQWEKDMGWEREQERETIDNERSERERGSERLHGIQ